MPSLKIKTEIAAGPEACFDAARNIDLHVESMAASGERAVAGVISGLIANGEEVTFEGRHFGIRQQLTSRITAYDRPRFFQDTMVKGAFAFFQHNHRFERANGHTLMVDEVSFKSPLGPIGALVDLLVLRGYLRRLVTARARSIKNAAERRRA